MGKKNTRFLSGKKGQPEGERPAGAGREGEEERILPGLQAFIEEGWEKKRKRTEDLDDEAVHARWLSLSSRLRAEGEEGLPEGRGAGEEKRRSTSPGLWYKIAAAVALLVAATFLFRGHHAARMKEQPVTATVTRVTVKNGEQKQLTLEDGTKIWLNGGSALSWGSGFGSSNRQVRLEGEGFFEVAKDAALPFTVETEKVTITVLGTSFNVKDYGNEDNVQTTLISGSIQVSLNNDASKKILLSPREKLTVMKGQVQRQAAGVAVNPLKYKVQALVPLSPTDSNEISETAWMGDKIAFVDEPFGEVAKKMEHRYNVHIFFKNAALKKVVMRGVFEKESVQKALKILQMITPFRYDQAGDSIYLYR